MVELVAGLGLSENTMIEANCKQYYSVNEILNVLVTLSKQNHQHRAFVAYIHLLTTIHVSSSCVLPLAHSMPLRCDPRIWVLLQSCIEMAQSVFSTPPPIEFESIDFHEVDGVIYVIMPFILEFLKTNYVKMTNLASGTTSARSNGSLAASDSNDFHEVFSGGDITPISEYDVVPRFNV